MAFDMGSWQEKDLGEIARKMNNIERRLELARGGQVFFLHNRIESIRGVEDYLKKLVPQAKIAVAHGQMGEGEMEEAMLKFIRHEADILVSTTIIDNSTNAATSSVP